MSGRPVGVRSDGAGVTFRRPARADLDAQSRHLPTVPAVGAAVLVPVVHPRGPAWPARSPSAPSVCGGVPGRRPSPRRGDGVKGTPLTPEQADARVDSYRGGKGASREAVEFVREAVRDAMVAAPQPVTKAWISYSTSAVGLLVRACEEQGLPLDREVVFERSRIDRFLSHGCKHLVTQARSGYRSRLDVVAGALLFGQNESAWPRATMRADDTVVPWDETRSARIALWTSGLRPATRRVRLRTSLALAEGAGLRRMDIVRVTGEHVTRDDHGVHLAVPGDPNDPADAGRTVTVTARWEQTVWDAAVLAGAHLLVAPDRTSLTVDAFTSTVDTANRMAPAGDEFTVRRARNTWLARHLLAGTPLPVLMAQAGLTTTAHIQDLLPHLPALDGASCARWMRSADA